MLRPDLAVVLCTYNGAPYVGEQLASILRQTVLPGSILVYDDNSTDETLHRIRDAYDARPSSAADVSLVVAPADGVQRGAVRNFERGLRDATTPLVALADQDDRWHPERIERGLAVLDASPEIDVVASNAAFIDGDGRAIGRTVFEAQRVEPWELEAIVGRDPLRVLARRNVLPGMTFTLRSDFVDRAGPIPPGTMHDYWLALSAAAGNALAVVPEPLVDYRIHGLNAVGLDTGDRSPAARLHARLRLVRAPLTDLAQWSLLGDRLSVDDPLGHLRLVQDKLRFERRRRFPGLRGPRRVLWLARLIASADYHRFDVGGWRGAVKDFLRPPAADPAEPDRP